VGTAGNITAHWKGFNEYAQGKVKPILPKMLGFQAEGAAPIVKKMIIKEPKTIATAIKIGNPASWQNAIGARDESNGLIDEVTDEEILAAYRLLSGQEGVFVEPASAASVAGIIKLSRQGYFNKIPAGAKIVCILTGHGLKDPDRAIKSVAEPKIIPAQIEAVLKETGIKKI
ncbi:MAG: pyridoxal-phosphate dependent enzyme, partial [Candidatus Omnitrophica bacterium]|nr:pyridoxal-phosphate dependent enzyme [Candidatus Omnitrophota bacterium]